jgi:hypothetical protein
MMERYQLADQLDPALNQQKQSKNDKDELKKSLLNSIDKKRKAKLKKNNSDALAPKNLASFMDQTVLIQLMSVKPCMNKLIE